jgi:hypothetical protein
VTCFSFVCTEPACALGSCFVLQRFGARCFFSQGCPFLALDPAAGPGLARAESALAVLPHSRSPVTGSICFFSCLPRAGVCWSRFLLCERRARSPPPGCVLVDRSVPPGRFLIHFWLRPGSELGLQLSVSSTYSLFFFRGDFARVLVSSCTQGCSPSSLVTQLLLASWEDGPLLCFTLCIKC